VARTWLADASSFGIFPEGVEVAGDYVDPGDVRIKRSQNESRGDGEGLAGGGPA
jgi:hypothetical protein